jgi:DNA-binding transcriptional ArsR family regulator
MSDESTAPVGMREPGPDHVVLDSTSLRALAHPLRVRLLGLLRENGPSTASRLAVAVGTTSGATSYHLRQLAAAGFIVEDEGAEDDGRQPRERWWRAAHRTTWFDTSSTIGDPEGEAATEVYLRSVIQAYSRRMEAALDEWPSLPEWRDTGTVSDWSFVMDPAMTTRMQNEIVDILERYRAEPELTTEDGRRPVTVQLQVFPRPGWRPEATS